MVRTLLRRRSSFFTIGLLLLSSTFLSDGTKAILYAQKAVIPHAQDRPPGPALSPAEAIQKMTVPEGFSVEVVAHEPDIMNPVAMAIDEQGRFWITESFEYPRREPGPGKDRIKILEDTDGDGRAEKITVFAEGLNIPSGIAVGHGGVWVANSPDILLMKDTNGDGKADQQEVIVTGFGRADTHELPNSLTWGPDGWLYGLNGVFNFGHVKYPESSVHYKQDHPGWPITCALFRIHPQTKEFQVFCEGTSNPWGVAFDNEGSAFISACVIDHLWHLVQTGYYHRQGGPYPPFTWKIDSIVKHKHQKAAYCGIHYFDSEAYPAAYRERLYMGNIHGGCLNVDRVQRDGATYFGLGEDDFLTANDAWFMPVVQKTGPDGSLYVLDWYDRYHCYQDANRDPQGIDRLKGRLYRIRYKSTPRAVRHHYGLDSDDDLITQLGGPNDYVRGTAQRILTERLLTQPAEAVSVLTEKLYKIAVGNTRASSKAQRHALFIICSLPQLSVDRHLALLNHEDPWVRAWGVRVCNTLPAVDPSVKSKVLELARDTSRDVQLQVAICAKKIAPEAAMSVLLNILTQSGDDKIIPRIVWQNLHPMLETDPAGLMELLAGIGPGKGTNIEKIVPRAVDRILGRKEFDPVPVARLLGLLSKPVEGSWAQPVVAQQCLTMIAGRVQTGEIAGAKKEALQKALAPVLTEIFSAPETSPLLLDAALLATSWGDQTGLVSVRRVFATTTEPAGRRVQAFESLVAAKDPELLSTVATVLSQPKTGTVEFRGQLLAGLGRSSDPKVAEIILAAYEKLEPELQPRAVELLTQRVDWSRALLGAISRKVIPASALNVNQVRKILAAKDPELSKQVAATWGTIRDQRNPQREAVIADMRRMLRSANGNPVEGQKIFARVCGQCHKLHGQGAEVGPDITLNGRGSFEQLLSNVFDPSLVIGASYQAQTVVTTDGRVLTGLVAEDSDQRIVLKVQGGKLEVIPRAMVDETRQLALSMMPEDLEKQLKPSELIDLFAYITLDKPPTDPTARKLPGSAGVVPRQSSDPTQFNEMVVEVAPGFSIAASGIDGVAILAEHRGRPGVLRTHPISRDQACRLMQTVTLPSDKKSKLLVEVSHHNQGDWRLIVTGGGERLLDEMISEETTKDGWVKFEIDLSKFAGKETQIGLINQANDWAWEYAFWGRVELVSE